jgi:hypothetical protein
MEVCNTTPDMATIAAIAIRPTIARKNNLINLFDHVNNSDTTLVVKPSKEEGCQSLVKFTGNQISLLALNIKNA